MELTEYLKKYDREEPRLVSWLSSNGSNVAIALEKLTEYAISEREFESGSELDHTLLKESMQKHIDKIKHPPDDIVLQTLVRLVDLYEHNNRAVEQIREKQNEIAKILFQDIKSLQDSFEYIDKTLEKHYDYITMPWWKKLWR